MLSETSALIQITDLRFQWQDDGSFTPKNEAFNLSIKKGEFTCLSAPSGYGKSTLIKYLLLKKSHNTLPYKVFGNCEINNSSIAYLPQNSQESLHPSFTISKQIKRFLDSQGFGGVSFVTIEKLLFDLGFNDPKEILGRTTTELSGGQKQRIALLLLLLKQPDVLILDEPSAALDKVNSQNLFKFLKTWAQENGSSILCITHQTDWISEFCDTLIRIKETDYNTSHLIKNTAQTDILLSLKNISYNYNIKKVINNLSIDFQANKTYAIIGSSGKGKSTLGKILSGHFLDFSGELKSKYFHTSPQKLDLKDLIKWRTEFIYVPQDSYAIFNAKQSFLDELQWLNAHTKIELPSQDSLVYWCSKINIDISILSRPVKLLSGGERQKLLLMQFLLKKPKMLILDEPTASLDEASKSFFFEFVLPFLKEDKNFTLLILTHDPSMINIADQVIEL